MEDLLLTTGAGAGTPDAGRARRQGMPLAPRAVFLVPLSPPSALACPWSTVGVPPAAAVSAQDLALHDCLYRNRGRAKWVAWGSLEEYWEDRTQPKGSLRDHLSGLDQTRTSHAVFTITTYASSFANSTDTSSLNCSEGNQGGTPGAPQGVPGNDTHRSAGDQAPLVEAFGRSFLRDVSACGGDQEATGSSTAQGEGSTLNPASDKCPWAQGLVLNPNLVSSCFLSSVMLTPPKH